MFIINYLSQISEKRALKKKEIITMLPGKKCENCKVFFLKEDDMFCGYCGTKLFDLHINKTAFEFSFLKRSHKEQIVIQNKGINAVSLTISQDEVYPRWLVLDKNQLTIKEKTQEIVTMSLALDDVDPDKSYATTLRISCPNLTSVKPLTVDVTLDKGPEPFILPGEITIDGLPVGAEKEGTLHIENHGSGFLTVHSITFEGDGKWLKFQQTDFSGALITDNSPLTFPYTITTSDLQADIFKGKIVIQFEDIAAPYEVSVYLKTSEGPRFEIPGAKEIVHDNRKVMYKKESNILKGKMLNRQLLIKNSGKEALRILRIVPGGPKSSSITIHDIDEIVVLPQREKHVSLIINTSDCHEGSNEFSILFYTNDRLREKQEFIYEIEIIEHIEEMDDFIGIDFGTTNSCVAYVHEEDNMIKPTLVKFDNNELMPSILYFEGHDNKQTEIMIGSRAANSMLLNPERAVRSLKRVLGTKSIRTFFGKTYTPTELASIIIKKIVEKTEDELVNKNIIKSPKKAILTVPANFFDNQIRALLEAARKAGLNQDENPDNPVGIIIDEPSAAAVYYIYKKYVENHEEPINEIILVYDFGGGTLDVSIIEIKIEGIRVIITVLATQGNNQIGGDDIDWLIVRDWADTIKKKHPDFDHDSVKLSTKKMKEHYRYYKKDILTDIIRVRNEFKDAAENRKIELTVINESKTTLYNLIDKNKLTENRPFLNNGSHTVTLKREELNKLITPLVEKSKKLIERALLLADLPKEKINALLFTGRSSQIPYIKETIKQFFTHNPKFYDEKTIPPKTCVAMGAAYWGYIRNKPGSNIEFRTDSNKLPYSYGMKIIDKLRPVFDPFIQAGDNYPIKKDKYYPQEFFGPGKNTFEILQNESDNNQVQGNQFIRKIGKIAIDPMADGKPGADVEYAVNKNRILQVTVDGKKIDVEPAYEELEEEGY